MTIAVLPATLKPLLADHLPDWVAARWWESPDHLLQLARHAEIGWFDMHDKAPMLDAVARAQGLRWLNSIYTGLDFLPMDAMVRRGVMLTNGAGLTSIAVAEFVVTGMLVMAKNYPAIVRAQDRHVGLETAPGTRELAGSRALLLGYGAIGKLIERQLSGFDVDVVPVSRSGRDGTLGPDEWQGQLGTFDWVILIVPGTPETEGIIGAAELAAMKPDAILLNFARHSCIDEGALRSALENGGIEAAMLDVTDPEPLPQGHPFWAMENVHLTMHLSGRPTPRTMERAAHRFLENLGRYHAGQPLFPQFDPHKGY